MKKDNEQRLLEILSVQQKISLSETMKLFDISESTARRLFAELETKGLVIRTHGGIHLTNVSLNSYSFESFEHANQDKKIAIAKKACELLRDGDNIFCDSGTTMQYFCNELVTFSKKNALNITVCTNSLVNLNILTPHIPVTLIGGDFRSNRRDFNGYIAEHALEKLYFDKCFVGTDGYISPATFTTTDHGTARIDEIAIQHSGSAYLLTDTTKFSRASHIAFVSAHELTAIITDSKLPKSIEHNITKQHCKIFYASNATPSANN